ncbi:MAG: HlyD family secretion protein [Verrucomicrobiota bacterium]
MAETIESSNSGGDPEKKQLSWLIWPIAIVGLIAAGIYAYKRYEFDRTHIVTDNAQVQGKLVKVLAPEHGMLEQVLVLDNQAIRKGDLLAELENEYYLLAYQQAQANLNVLIAQKGGDKDQQKSDSLAAAKLSSAQANLQVIQAQLAEAQAAADQADAEVKRMERNKQSRTFVQAQYNLAKANAEQSKAQVATLQKESYAAGQRVQEALASAKLLDFNIDQARAQVAQAKLSLSYTEIRSPINGNVAQLNIYPGSTVEQGQYMMTVVSADDKWLVANIKETLFEKVFLGDKVDIKIDAFPGTDFRGVVESYSPAAGNQFSILPRNNASGNFIKVEALIPVRIKFTEPLTEIEKLVPGMSAEVTITIDPDRKWEKAEEPAYSEPATSTASADSAKPSSDVKSPAVADSTKPAAKESAGDSKPAKDSSTSTDSNHGQ